ncbi:collectin-11 [Biomphalaria pfeifferi]|uniref:Collectin-11 n=1 Tax=Biomphalaria pfeifferi TaxID=112525 RepID=A0AAD8BI59_BIOPF|nr:collectin-11 [Biomphalaria pfeifferi]
MFYLISLSLYRSANKTDLELIYIASINRFDADVQAAKVEDTNAKFSGQINNKNESFLRVVWEFPDLDKSGVYKCEASGINTLGKAVTLSSTAVVIGVRPDNEQLVDTLQKLTQNRENLQSRMNSTEDHVRILDNFNKLKFSEQNNLTNALFVVSPTFQGKRYMLIKNQLYITANLAEVLCGVFGGYLVEVDSEEEFRFIRDNLLELRLFSFVVTGATDEKQERVWINRYSKTPAKVFNWGPGEPNGGNILTLLEAAVITNVEPTTLTVGLSRNLKVECLYSQGQNLTMSYLMSLSIYHAMGKTESDFSFIASINSFDSDVQAEKLEDSNAIFFGQINNKNESFLRIVWKFPKLNRSGVYKCEASGINTLGKAVTLSSTAVVIGVRPDNELLVDTLQKLTQNMEILQSRMNSTEDHVRILDNFNKLKFSEQNNLTNALFVVSPTFQGKRYMLIKNQLYITANLAEVLCGVFGGYLVEIDSDEEYRFIRDHLLSLHMFYCVLTGGTDEKREGVWINRYSKTPAKYMNWGRGEPNGGNNENCQSYGYYVDSWYMNDIPCSLLADCAVGFICEVDIKN